MPTATADLRRFEIIQAAMRALSEGGLPMPSYDRIASHAGLSRQLLRHYYPDPELLFVEVCKTVGDAFRAAISSASSTVEPVDRLNTFIDLLFNVIDQPYEQLNQTLIGGLYSLSAGSEIIRESVFAQLGLLHDLAAAEVSASHPELDETTCREFAYLIVAMIHGHQRMTATLGYSDDHREIARKALSELLLGYVNKHQKATNREIPISAFA